MIYLLMYVFLWVWLSLCVAFFARRYNRTDSGYMVMSLVFSPLLVWLMLLSLGKLKHEV